VGLQAEIWPKSPPRLGPPFSCCPRLFFPHVNRLSSGSVRRVGENLWMKKFLLEAVWFFFFFFFLVLVVVPSRVFRRVYSVFGASRFCLSRLFLGFMEGKYL